MYFHTYVLLKRILVVAAHCTLKPLVCSVNVYLSCNRTPSSEWLWAPLHGSSNNIQCSVLTLQFQQNNRINTMSTGVRSTEHVDCKITWLATLRPNLMLSRRSRQHYQQNLNFPNFTHFVLILFSISWIYSTNLDSLVILVSTGIDFSLVFKLKALNNKTRFSIKI